ncbi:hypothetical protein BKH43_00585 [Helicobacter sp. 13S00401-1]|uniref:flagellar basal body-associated FliL family protein n=1 Tax=Helicobacter sp. 13S00401-1 TaxID=1905758 RepID=UPI000BA600AE|nr:flagellar basal body-associated FliL family protein [Helicobacter sp. 13S00401-1]PAF51766.1 hypothetical protein BKH43_00585 [Helicobacter sp. 13S00401-1]
MNKRPIVILVIFIIVLIIILVLLFIFFKPAKNIAPKMVESNTQEMSKNTSKPFDKMDILKNARYLYVFSEPFIVDLKPSPPNTLPLKLRLKLSFVLENKQLVNELNTKEPLIREIVSDTASTLTPGEVEGVVNRDNLKSLLKTKINQILEDGKVRYIVFDGFNIDA